MQAPDPELPAIVRRVVGRLLAGGPDEAPRLPGVFVERGDLRPGSDAAAPQGKSSAGNEAPAGRPGLVIAVGSDHGGYEAKQRVLTWLREAGHRPLDLGTHDQRPCDYPDFALAVALAVSEGRARFGVCLDGAGIGSAMAANKVPGIRAANGTSAAHARNAREHNYANVLTLGARLLEPGDLREILLAFLSTPEGEARHGARVAKIDAIERRFARPAEAAGLTSPRAP
jgi:ribose 5-phosphate isomerase B